jgi:hypothetical protein
MYPNVLLKLQPGKQTTEDPEAVHQGYWNSISSSSKSTESISTDYSTVWFSYPLCWKKCAGRWMALSVGDTAEIFCEQTGCLPWNASNQFDQLFWKLSSVESVKTEMQLKMVLMQIQTYFTDS